MDLKKKIYKLALKSLLDDFVKFIQSIVEGYI
jgi:hypothetical protein